MESHLAQRRTGSRGVLGPRTHSPSVSLAIAVALTAVAVLGTLALPTASAVATPAMPVRTHPAVDSVVVIITPFLTWNDISASRTPELWQLASQGAVGNMNSDTAEWNSPTVAGGALSLSSSRWAAGPLGASATATDLAAIRAANAASLDAPDIGALGAALHAAGLKTAAVGNADADTSTPAGIQRPAELVAMDRDGRVDIRLTSESLLATESAAPFGVRTNPAALGVALHEAMVRHPSLLVVDPGDLERAHDASGQSAEQSVRSHSAAVRSANDVAAEVRRTLADRHALLIVVTPATDKPYYQRPYFGPTIVVGDTFSGDLTSASTQQPGLIANVDVAPTILWALGLETTSTMVGQPMTSSGAAPSAVGGSALGARIASLSELGESVGAIDYVRDLFFISLFSWIVVGIALLAALAALVPALGRLRIVAQWLILAALCVPAGAWLLFAVSRYPTTPGQVAFAFGGATVAVFAVVLALSTVLRSRSEVMLLALSTLTSLLICADQWTGHPYETGLFSYSVRAGWRYYGMGNEGAALLVGASIVAVGLVCDLVADTRWARAVRIGLPPLVAIVAIVTSAAPFAGANAGAAVWGVVAFGVAWARINRVRLTWGTAAAIVGTIVALVAALVAIDATSGSAETHLGHFFADFATGNYSAAGDLVVRKALNALGYAQQTPYAWLAVAIAGALVVAWWPGQRPLARALATRPGVAGALLGVVIGGVVAMLTEDSGIVMPALMLFAGALPALYLSLEIPAQDA